MTARWITADVFDGLATLDDGSVDLVVTSPPFLALRSYLPADHPDKSKEIGSEATPAEFIDTLLNVTAELRRVLAPHGSICVELGDTYAGGGNGPDALKPSDNGAHDLWLDASVPKRIGQGWPLAKSRALIPQLYEIALAYGINPLTGQPSPAGQWRIRNVVTWARPNPPVGALGDKWRPATSDLIVACTSPKRYWDDLATRRPHQSEHRKVIVGKVDSRDAARAEVGLSSGRPQGEQNPSGAPLLDYWEIPPGGFNGAHYAVFPPELVVPLVKAMCPEKVCRVCGEPSRRITKDTGNWSFQPELAAHIKERREALGISIEEINDWFGYVAGAAWWETTTKAARVPNAKDWPILKERLGLSDDFDRHIYGDRRWTELAVTDAYRENLRYGEGSMYSAKDVEPKARHGARPMTTRTAEHISLGWTDCGHDDYRPGIVLDPFAGSGTTLAVATGHGHDAIGIDLDPRNADLARDRIGPFFFEEVAV